MMSTNNDHPTWDTNNISIAIIELKFCHKTNFLKMLQARKGKNQTSTPGRERQMVAGVKTRVLGGRQLNQA
jgi:hypothetical protein